MKKTVLVLFGGTSNEYEVSLKSATSVIQTIDQDSFDVIMLGITKSGQWLLYTGSVDNIPNDNWWKDPACLPAILSPSREDHGIWIFSSESCDKQFVDIAFPVMHGRFGEDGTIQGLLELAGIPFVGCPSKASALAMDKAITHQLATESGIDCPRFTTVYKQDGGRTKLIAAIQKGMAGISFPWFVKPASEGSSFGITKVLDMSGLSLALETAFRFENKIVVEEGIDGFEVGTAVLGNRDLFVGSVDAIGLQKGFFDYHEKYNLETAEILLPAPIDSATTTRIQNTAIKIYKLFDCKGYSRIDFFLSSDGRLIFNEINTIPGLTAHSRYPRMLANAGIAFDVMIRRLINLAEEDT